MKKYLIIVLFITIVSSIMAQMPKTRIEQSLIAPNFEKFDSLMFNKLKKKEKDITVYGSLDDGRYIVFRNFTISKDYIEYIPNSYYCIYKAYYSDNYISVKGISFIYHGFKVGTWYYFDENGNLTQTINHDKPFKFTLDDVFKFLEKEKIPIKKEWDNDIDGFYRTGINRTYNSEKSECFWEIDWFNYDTRKVERIRLDGTTGKELSREYQDYIV